MTGLEIVSVVAIVAGVVLAWIDRRDRETGEVEELREELAGMQTSLDQTSELARRALTILDLDAGVRDLESSGPNTRVCEAPGCENGLTADAYCRAEAPGVSTVLAAGQDLTSDRVEAS